LGKLNTIHTPPSTQFPNFTIPQLLNYSCLITVTLL